MANIAQLSILDSSALICFFALWIGYARYHRVKSKRAASLMGTVNIYRREWMVRLLERDQRIVDTSILANLSNSATFFASTTLLILGGLLALLGTKEKVASVMADLSFGAKAPEQQWELKILLLILIFIYAFFVFTWSLRQFNFLSILAGAAPQPGVGSTEERERFVNRAGRLVSLAGESFNNGLRAYYFALAGLMWFVHPVMLMAAAALVVLILYWREFRSETLRALIND